MADSFGPKVICMGKEACNLFHKPCQPHCTCTELHLYELCIISHVGHPNLDVNVNVGLVYIGECMLPIINIIYDIKKPTHGYQNWNASQILIFGGYVKVREFLYTWIIIWVHTILKHIDTRVISPRYESYCMVYKPEWYQNQRFCQFPMPYWYQKVWNFIIDIQMVLRITIVSPALDTFGRLLLSTFDKSIHEWRRRSFAKIVWDSLAGRGPPTLMLAAVSVTPRKF